MIYPAAIFHVGPGGDAPCRTGRANAPGYYVTFKDSRTGVGRVEGPFPTYQWAKEVACHPEMPTGTADRNEAGKR